MSIIGSWIHSLQTKGLGKVTVKVFEMAGEQPVVCVTTGDLNTVPEPLVRIHSRCLYSEVFGSLDCDCHAQIELSFKLFAKERAGILVYLEQEGRGCGIISKAKAYILRDTEKLDTVSAYKQLGLQIDCRQYFNAAEVLNSLGVRSFRLLTNDPNKYSAMLSQGFSVRRIPLVTEPTSHNIEYLWTKQQRLDHEFNLTLEKMNSILTDFKG